LGVGLVAILMVGVADLAFADAFDNFPVETQTDDSPSCLVVETNNDDSLLGFINDCSSSVVMESTECRGWECTDTPFSETSVPPNEGTGISPQSLGLSEEEFEEGDTFDLAVSWSRESETGEYTEEGEMVFEVRYAEGRDGSPDGCGGCRVSRRSPGAAAWLLIPVVAAACSRRLVRALRVDPCR
jgi:hypothetical protein